jgi:sugar transferase (PEP-CTERM/EpsH1 system associated)
MGSGALNGDVDRIMPDAADPARPDLLYLVHRFPYPPDKGDRIRTFHLLESLSRWAWIHLACLADEPPEDSSIAALRRHCRRIAVVRPRSSARWLRALGSLARGRTATEGAFGSPELRAVIRRWARGTRFHAGLASASSLVPYLRMDELRDIPAVIDLIDVDSQKWLDYAAASRGPRAWLYRTEGRRLRRLEHDLPDWARAVTLVSEAEVDLYRRFRAGGAVHAIPNGVDLDYFRPDPRDDGRGCVFVGAFDYRPNVDGACWFCREAWPEVRRRHPPARLALVGRRPAPAVRRLARSAGVDLVGQVPDVRPHLAGAAVAVVPLHIARGVQNKVLEALAMGKAVVSSPQALVGLHVEPGIHLLAASTPGEWADAVSRLLDDRDLRRQLGSAGRCYVEEHHRWDRCLEPFGAILGLTTGLGAPWAHPDPAFATRTGAGPLGLERSGRDLEEYGT